MVQIITIVISKTGSVHTRTLAEIAQLVLFKKNPPKILTYKSLPPQAQTIDMAIHVHAHEWLTLMSKVSRNTLTQRKKTTKHPTKKIHRQLKKDVLGSSTQTPMGKVQEKRRKWRRLDYGEGKD